MLPAPTAFWEQAAAQFARAAVPPGRFSKCQGLCVVEEEEVLIRCLRAELPCQLNTRRKQTRRQNVTLAPSETPKLDSAAQFIRWILTQPPGHAQSPEVPPPQLATVPLTGQL